MDYTLRDIPPELHRSWKSSAALRGWSMKDYCYVALNRQIREDLEKGFRKENTDVDGETGSE